MATVVPESELVRRRALRRIAQYNETIDHFTEISRDALRDANAHERAKLRYIDSLPDDVRRDIGYA